MPLSGQGNRLVGGRAALLIASLFGALDNVVARNAKIWRSFAGRVTQPGQRGSVADQWTP
jgi:hypothetical protein